MNGEKYTFKPNSNGTVQIIVNGTETGKFIDPVQNTIGGTNGAGPTIVQWVKWYFEQSGDSEKIAYAKTYQILYPLLLPHVSPKLWNRNAQKENAPNFLSKTFPDVILPELDPEKIAKSLVNKDFMNGIQTGYKYFDLTTGGFKRQFSYLLAARSKNLKSMFSVNLLFRVAGKGIPVAYFDLENGDFLGNFVCLSAIVSYIKKISPPLVTIVAMGEKGIEKTDEDELCALSIRDLLLGNTSDFVKIKNQLITSASALKFFDLSRSEFNEEDFYLAMDFSKFNFILKVHKEGNSLFITKEE